MIGSNKKGRLCQRQSTGQNRNSGWQLPTSQKPQRQSRTTRRRRIRGPASLPRGGPEPLISSCRPRGQADTAIHDRAPVENQLCECIHIAVELMVKPDSRGKEDNVGGNSHYHSLRRARYCEIDHNIRCCWAPSVKLMITTIGSDLVK